MKTSVCVSSKFSGLPDQIETMVEGSTGAGRSAGSLCTGVGLGSSSPEAIEVELATGGAKTDGNVSGDLVPEGIKVMINGGNDMGVPPK